MNHIIVCYSFTGNNQKLALKLQEALECEILNIKEKKKRKTLSILLDFIFHRKTKLLEYNLSNKYDLFIFIAPIWGSKLATPMREFIKNEKNRIKKYCFITICNGVEGQFAKLKTEFISILQSEPIKVKELWINNLLPENKRNKVKYTFNFRASTDDLLQFNNEINDFVSLIKTLN